jgi:hypothetical protein
MGHMAASPLKWLGGKIDVKVEVSNDPSGDIEQSFASQGASPSGLTWDGTNLWNADFNSNTNYKLDPSDGSLISSFTSPTGGTNASDLAWDGTNLWQAGWDGFIYKIDPSDGTTLDTLAGPTTSLSGLTWDGTNLRLASSGTDLIYRVDPSDGTVLDSFASPGPVPRGLAWDGTNLWNADWSTELIYKLDPSDGTVLDSFPTPSADPESLTWDGTYLWLTDTGTHTIYKLEVREPWIDVTGDVMDVTINRGKERWAERFRVGSAVVLFDNTSGVYSTGSQVLGDFGEWRIGRELRILSIPDPDAPTDRHCLFTGVVEDSDDEYNQAGFDLTCRVLVLDALSELHDHNPPALTTATANHMRSDTYVGTALDRIPWPDARRIIEGGLHTMQPSFLAQTTLEECMRAGEAEGGAFYADCDNKVVFRNRDWLLGGAESMIHYEDAVQAKEPIAYWRMGDDTNRTVDSTGNGHTLTWNGSPAAGVEGVTEDDIAIPLDGSNDYATVASEAALELRQDMTIEMWVRPHNTEGGEAICCRGTGSGSTLYEIQFWSGSALLFPAATGGSSYNIGSVTVNDWQHIVVTIAWNGDGTRTLTGFVNGNQQSPQTYAYEPGVVARDVNIGRRVDGGSGFLYFDGDISELAIYDKVLTAEEVEANYEAKELGLNTRSTTIQGYLGYNPDDLPAGSTAARVTDIKTSHERARVRNDIQFSRTGGTAYRTTDAGSIDLYRHRTYQRLDMRNSTQAQVEFLADRYLDAHKDSKIRVTSATIVANDDPDNEDLNRLFWDTQFGDLLQIKIQTAYDWALTRPVHVFGIRDRITPSDWTREFLLDDAQTAAQEQWIVVAWTGTEATIPSGWVRVDNLDGRYPKGGPEGAGVVGGSDTHSHGGSTHHHKTTHSHTQGSTAAGTAGTAAAANTTTIVRYNHTHPRATTNSIAIYSQYLDPGLSQESNDVPRKEVIFIRPEGAFGGEFPVGSVTFFNDATPPTGWVSEDTGMVDGDYGYLKGTSGDGSSSFLPAVAHSHLLAAHTHTVANHAHSSPNRTGNAPTVSSNQSGSSGGSHHRWSSTNHTHPMTVNSATPASLSSASKTSDTATHAHLVSMTLALIRKDSGTGLADGLIVIWMGAVVDIPSGWAWCNGENGTPDLRNRYPEYRKESGAWVIGETRDTPASHNHTGLGHSHSTSGHAHSVTIKKSDSATVSDDQVTGTAESRVDHGHSASNTNSATPTVDSALGSSSSHAPEPPFYDVVWIMKVTV